MFGLFDWEVLALGPTVVDVRLRAGGEVVARALVDAGFYGDVITRLRVADAVGVGLKYVRRRRLPDGGVVDVRYGGCEIEVLGEVTWGDLEVWEGLELPLGIDALLGVTALEKLGFKVDPKTGKLEKIELYLL